MDEEADKNLTHEEEPESDSSPPTPKKDPLPPPSEKEDADPPSTKPEILLRPPIEPQQHDSNRLSAATLPLPNRPQSTASDINNESIYDQLPATLQRKPIAAAAVIPPVTEEPSEDGASAKQKEIQEIEANQKKYDDINTHKVCTIVTMVLCSVILNIFAFSCLIPAYCYSLKSREYLNNEDLPNAEKYARRSLILNLIAVIVTFTVLIVVFIILQIVFAAAGLY